MKLNTTCSWIKNSQPPQNWILVFSSFFTDLNNLPATLLKPIFQPCLAVSCNITTEWYVQYVMLCSSRIYLHITQANGIINLCDSFCLNTESLQFGMQWSSYSWWVQHLQPNNNTDSFSQISTGFLQVRENGKKLGNLCGQGKVREK